MEPIIIDGKPGRVSYLDGVAKVLFDDGRVVLYHARTARGTQRSGNRGHGGRPGKVGGSAPTIHGRDARYDTEGKLRNERSLRALKAFKTADKKTQKWGDKGEVLIHGMTKGTRVGGKEPVDEITYFGGRTQGVEVKTLTKQGNDKITMRKDAVQRKFDWSAENDGAPVHTIAIDYRDLAHPNPNTFSGHRVYFHPGVGSFRLGSMTPVRDERHLAQLLGKRYGVSARQ